MKRQSGINTVLGHFFVLREALRRRERRVLERPLRAAVLVPIVGAGGRGPEAAGLLLTRRTDTLPTHAGQVAFPGGLARAGEDDPQRTALREAEEEIGLSAGAVEVLGLMDDVAASTGTVAVTPVVGRLEALPELRLRPDEVARVFTIPLAELARPGRWTSRLEERGGHPCRVHYFEHDGETLWGLSALIVLRRLELTPAGSPVSLEADPA